MSDQPASSVPPQNIDAERELLGAALTLDGIVVAVQAEIGLRVGDFYFDRHRAIWEAMLTLAGKDTPISELTLADHLSAEGLAEAGGQDYLGQLGAMVNNPGAFLTHARIVQEKARWRRRLTAGQEIQAAALEGDAEAFARAQALLADDPSHERAMHNADRQKDSLYELIEGQGKAEFYWPIEKLNALQSGGMRRGQLIVVSGYTNEGKSHFAGQILDGNRKHGRVCLYDNEMQPVEQAARRAVRLGSKLDYGKLLNGKLDDEERSELMKQLNRDEIYWPIVDIAGWTPQEVALHIRQHRFDLVVIDILHNFPFSEEREIAKAVAEFKAAARLANCVIVLVAHVNRAGVDSSGKRRRPTRHDLRWSGEIENLADAVCFVYREQDAETKEPTEDGFIYFDKCRGGGLGAEQVRFVTGRLRFQREEALPDSHWTDNGGPRW